MSAEEEEIYDRCLTLAEKIIGELSNKSVVKQYNDVKNQIIKSPLSPRPKTPPKSIDEFSSLTLENQKLKSELAKQIKSRPNILHNDNSEQVILQIHELQKRILPGQLLPVSNDIVEEIESLRRVIDAKLKSMNLIRSKLRTENVRLRNDLKVLHLEASSKVEEVEKKGREEKSKIDEEEAAASERIAMIEGELEDVREEYEAVWSENKDLKEKVKKLRKDIDREEKEIRNQTEALKGKQGEVKELERVIEKLREQLGEQQRNVASRRFGGGGKGGRSQREESILDELCQLSDQIDVVRNQNTQMERQLMISPERSLNAVDAGKLDEDDLARKLLLSQWK